MHLRVNDAVIRGAHGLLPALGMLTALSAADRVLLLCVLPEVERFTRVNFTSDSVIKILVRYFTVSVYVKVIVELLKHFLRAAEAPVIEIKLQLWRGDTLLSAIFIHVLECLQNRRPLLTYFQNDPLLKFFRI